MHSLQCLLWKEKNLDGTPVRSPFTFQTTLVCSPAIVPRCILIFHNPPVSVMIFNNLSIELDYLLIHHPYLFLLTLRNSQTWKGWNHNNIVIRLLSIKHIKLFLVPFTNKTSHIINMFWPEVIVNGISIKPPSPIESLFYQCTSLHSCLTHFQ